ncbi:hypothetical protein [Agromyces marinus]|uniref:DUF3592 domain-containing protein n=2 Tax=Agromyces marinus TaxID=1389020 RepID=A0ABM8GYD9_9MICO|nr:hypothetical protein [Agromyces marinus]BDZ53501.1 hypothetical protein GCM10025870_05740 [Agromyces marinus]
MADARRRTEDRPGYPPLGLTAAVLALGAILLGSAAVVGIAEVSARASASYEAVVASIVDEGSEQQLVADRRGSRQAQYRVVSVELADGTRAEIRSDDLAVGERATVYRSTGGTIAATIPDPPGPLEWAVCAGAVLGALALAVASVRTILPARTGRSPATRCGRTRSRRTRPRRR